jgi:hypothetical protein
VLEAREDPRTGGAITCAKEAAMAWARISIGKISTPWYAELAAAEPTKKTADQQSVCVVAVSTPLAKRWPVTASITPDPT